MYTTSEEVTDLQESVETVEEGIMGALKKVGKAVLGPADQSPEAEAARMGKRRGPGTPTKKAGTPNNSGGSGGTVKGGVTGGEAAAVAGRARVEKLKTQGESYDANADVFDIVKEYLMTEHDATEEEALKVMLELTDDERTAIVEGTPADRARRAVKNQRDGYYGDDHALTKEMEATKAAVARLKKV